jgi:hypothetical protein
VDGALRGRLLVRIHGDLKVTGGWRGLKRARTRRGWRGAERRVLAAEQRARRGRRPCGPGPGRPRGRWWPLGCRKMVCALVPASVPGDSSPPAWRGEPGLGRRGAGGRGWWSAGCWEGGAPQCRGATAPLAASSSRKGQTGQ